MKYKKIDCGSYKLHLINTNKFKTTFIKVVFRNNIKKDKLTINNFLLCYLLTSTKKYPKKRDIALKTYDLYGVNLSDEIYQMGNLLISNIKISALNEKYTSSNLLYEVLDFLKEIIFNPNVENNEFVKENFDLVKENLTKQILSIKERPNTYAAERFYETMANDAPVSFHETGYISDIENITEKKLYEYYLEMLNTNSIDIFIVGEFNNEKLEKYIKSNFDFEGNKTELLPLRVDNLYPKNEILKVVEDTNYKQSSLFLGYTFDDINDDNIFAMFLFNIIFASSADSRLFKIIRERNSLVYNISGVIRNYDNIYRVKAEISYKNCEKAIKLIEEELTNIIDNGITDKELDNAKKIYITTCEDMFEYPSSIADYYFTINYSTIHDDESVRKIVSNLTKKDIVEAAKKLKLNTIYIQKEDSNEED